LDYDMINFQIETENDVTNLKTLVDSIKQQTAKYDADEKKKDPKHKDKKLSLSLPRYLTQESDCSAIFNSNNFENIFGDDQKTGYIMNINLDINDLYCDGLECLNDDMDAEVWFYNCYQSLLNNKDSINNNDILISVTAQYDGFMSHNLNTMKYFTLDPSFKNLAFIAMGFDDHYTAEEIHHCLYDVNKAYVEDHGFLVKAIDGYQYDKDSSFAKRVKESKDTTHTGTATSTTTPIVDQKCKEITRFYGNINLDFGNNSKLQLGLAETVRAITTPWWVYFLFTVSILAVIIIVCLIGFTIHKKKMRKIQL